MDAVGVVVYGVGAIGSRIARLLLERGYRIVGAVDVDERKVGRDLGELVGVGRIGVYVKRGIDEALSEAEAQVAVHCTTSYLRQVYQQILKLVEHGLNVVSTCEELAYPYIVDAELTKKIDSAARGMGVRVLGTGVNPGFMMDTLVLTLTAVCQKVSRVYAARIIDASKRRLPFQRKIGIGLDPQSFVQKVQAGGMGHVGFRQSIHIVADTLGWSLSEVREGLDAVIAEQPVESHGVKVEAGRVAGVKQWAAGFSDGREAIRLEMHAYVGAEDHDIIRIDAVPPINLEIRPGVHGDEATAAMVVNTIPLLLRAPPGLITMNRLPAIPHATMPPKPTE